MKLIVGIKETVKREREVDICDVEEDTPIFAKRNGKLKGMVLKDGVGWILTLGGDYGATGHHEDRRNCLKSCLEYNYEFFIEED